MKEFLYGWIRDIAFYAILMTVILHLLPEEGQKKYVRFFMGVVLMLVVLSPLLPWQACLVRWTAFTQSRPMTRSFRISRGGRRNWKRTMRGR